MTRLLTIFHNSARYQSTGTYARKSSFSTDSPASREELMNNYFTLSKLSKTDPGSWPDYAVCLFTNNILPSSLCIRVLFIVSGVRGRPDDAAASSPEAKTDISCSPTEFTAAEEEFYQSST